MKKLIFLSKESLYSGNVITNTFEIIDFLANALSDYYKIYIICQKEENNIAKKIGRIKEVDKGMYHSTFLKIEYYLLNKESWEKSYQIIDKISPDIINFFDEAEDIIKISCSPQKKFFIFNDIEKIKNKEFLLKKYDAILSSSSSLIEEAKKIVGFEKINFVNINNGFLYKFFSPSNGILIPKAYDYSSLENKQLCKKKICNKFNLSIDTPIFLTGSLTRNYNLLTFLENIEQLKEIVLFVIGQPDISSINQIRKMRKNGQKIFILNQNILPLIQIPSFVAGADFFIQLDSKEIETFLSFLSCSYGIIPIVSSNNKEIREIFIDGPIYFKEDYNSGYQKAIQIYNNKQQMKEQQVICMKKRRDWEEAKKRYITLYEE